MSTASRRSDSSGLRNEVMGLGNQRLRLILPFGELIELGQQPRIDIN
jgi:hypothetical protein